MFIPTNNFVNLAYVTSIGLGGGFLAKKIVQTIIWSWNYCIDDNRRISRQTQEKMTKICEIIGGLFFAILAAREVFSENIILKQIKNLKADLRNLDKEVSELFKLMYNGGKNAIRNFQLTS